VMAMDEAGNEVPQEPAEEKKQATSDSAPAATEEVVLVNRTVIDEKLIREAVVDDVETDEAGNPLKLENIELQEIKELTLSFQNIYAIDNLLGFEQLVQLKLDNNIIDKIENLDHLVSLTWLDLSFNNIKKIENLDSLSNLTDLSLFHNNIEKIENLSKLTKLNVLSLGNNRITELHDIKALRQFDNLRLLNLKGNKVYEEEEYSNTVFAYLTKLKYLDYELIDTGEAQKALDSKLDQIVELKEKEKMNKKEQVKDDARLSRIALLNSSNLEGMQTLFDEIIKADAEVPKIRILPGFGRILTEYREKFDKVVGDFQELILERYKIKQEEKELFKLVNEKITKDNENKSIDIIQSFEAKKKIAFASYVTSKKPAILDSLKLEVATLSDRLMDLEMLLVEQVNDVLDEFQETYQEIVLENANKGTEAFKELQDACNWYLSEVTDVKLGLLNKFAKDELKGSEEVPEVIAMLSDKDVLNTCITTSFENHLAKVLAKDDQIREREDGECKALVSEVRGEEYDRNRHRVAEIHELVDRYINAIEEKAKHEGATEEEDYGI